MAIFLYCQFDGYQHYKSKLLLFEPPIIDIHYFSVDTKLHIMVNHA
eukprot:UN34410